MFYPIKNSTVKRKKKKYIKQSLEKHVKAKGAQTEKKNEGD